MNPTLPTQPAVGSMQYDLANNLAPGTSSSYSQNFNGTYTQPKAVTSPQYGSTGLYTGEGVNPTNQPVSITANSLATTTPITVPTPANTVNNTAAAVIGGSTAGATTSQNQITDYTKQIDANYEQARKDAEAAAKNPALTSALGTFGNKIGLTAAEEAKVPALESSRDLARNLTQEYQTKQLQYNKVMESIFNDPRQTSEQKAQAFDQINRTHAFDLTDLSIRQNIAVGNYQALQDSVDKRINLLYGDAKDQVEYYTKIKENADLKFTKAEERILDQKKAEAERKVKEGDDLKKTINTLTVSAVSQEAPPDVIANIAKARTEQEAITAAGKYAGDILDREYKKAQIANVYDTINERARKATEEKSPAMVSEKLNELTQTGDPISNKAAIAAILSGKTVSSGTKGRLAPANSVLNAVDEFASNRPTGEFVGMGVFGRAKEFYEGLVNAKDPAAIENMQSVDAINLKVQQWASGAALTEQQTKQVNKMTPKSGDSDKVIRTKLNGLYNYMLNQVESDLLTDGVNVNFKPVNLFETRDLLEQASPEQRAELKAAGLID